MKRTVTVIAGLILLLTAISLFSQGRGQGMRGNPMGARGPMGGWINEAVLQEIGVSDEIRKQIREIVFQTRKEMLDQQFLMREKRLIHHQEYLKPILDQAKINALSSEIWTIQQLQFQRIEKARLAIAQLLTPEQRTKLSKLILEKKRNFWGGMRYLDN